MGHKQEFFSEKTILEVSQTWTICFVCKLACLCADVATNRNLGGGTRTLKRPYPPSLPAPFNVDRPSATMVRKVDVVVEVELSLWQMMCWVDLGAQTQAKCPLSRVHKGNVRRARAKTKIMQGTLSSTKIQEWSLL